MNISAVDLLKIILCFILPPLAVFLDRGCDCSFFLNIILTILCWIPGVIHALIVVCS
ncbi:UPF0057-domain-containing protein [Neocallimastix lanati (nom. inval.)]|jgi:uncharacterized membrane protein YqaE (UPF0057 family)|uniref:UPF0057-domain-containing protein n=1 Tax=Neocallimastix californiae TaxID=1754190 RepID=A0A1Y1ZZ90_9FUNG|nr:UPF0057-domain-containing protein [Neocallimastix sp. JGI-2020a]ORY15524.1 UPF0057-domain-containing protein [Neocallimastix californiae]|eukprot:ORY15524.1 UPF0057-domain-containing protein [Neocallimastix californiae]